MSGVLTTESMHSMKKFIIGLVGIPKSGKTWLAATAQKPFFFDGEDGLSGAVSILNNGKNPEPFGYAFGENYENGNPKFPTGWLYFKRVVVAFLKGEDFKLDGITITPSQYETVVFDPWTSLGGLAWNYSIAEFLKDGGKNTFLKYQVYLEEGRWFTEQIKALRNAGFHVIVTFHVQDKDTNSSGVVIRRAPYMEGRALPQVLLPAFDELMAVEAKHGIGGKRETILHTRNYGQIDGLGSRHGLPEKIMNPHIGDIISTWQSTVERN